MTKKVRVSQILLSEESDATKVRELLNYGGSFKAAAREYSLCPSKDAGGDLGYFKKGDLGPEIDKFVFDAKKGEISSPIRTEYGWHIVYVTDIKDDGVVEKNEDAVTLTRLFKDTKDYMLKHFKHK